MIPPEGWLPAGEEAQRAVAPTKEEFLRAWDREVARRKAERGKAPPDDPGNRG